MSWNAFRMKNLKIEFRIYWLKIWNDKTEKYQIPYVEHWCVETLWLKLKKEKILILKFQILLSLSVDILYFYCEWDSQWLFIYIFVEWIFVVVVILVAAAESKRKIINNINSRKLRFFFFLSSSNDAWICCNCVHFTNSSNGSVIPRYLQYIFPGFKWNCFFFLFVFVIFCSDESECLNVCGRWNKNLKIKINMNMW